MKKAILVCCLVCVSIVGSAQETTNRTDQTLATTVLIASSITLGAAYVATIVVDATTGGRIDFYENFIPGIGPLIAFARYDSYVSSSYASSSVRSTEKALLALSGVIQSASIVGIVYGILTIRDSKKDSQKGGLSFEPYGANGIKVVYRY